MSKEYPELIFVAGPQKGQRVKLTRPVAILGRGADADVLFTEQYISRKHLKYEMLPDGPTFEILSKQGVWVNGKRYKAGKKIILETGDLIGLGLETQVLFVSAGDDPELALFSYKESLKEEGAKDAFGREIKHEEEKVEKESNQPEAVEAVEEEVSQQAELDKKEKEKEARKTKAVELSPSERIEAERRARRRKIAIGLCIYFIFIIIGAIILKSIAKPSDESIPMPLILTNSQVRDAIKAQIKRTPNIVRMREKLKEAISLYEQFGLDESRLYECARAFKEALAYSGQNYFDDPKYDFIYHEVLKKLTDVIWKKYTQACLWEKNKDWARAEAQFQEILTLFPEEDSILFKNVLKHLNRIKKIRRKKKREIKRPW